MRRLGTTKYQNMSMNFQVVDFGALGGPWSTSSTYKWCGLLAPVVVYRTRDSHSYCKIDLKQVHEAPRGHKVPEREDEFAVS